MFSDETRELLANASAAPQAPKAAAPEKEEDSDHALRIKMFLKLPVFGEAAAQHLRMLVTVLWVT